MKLPELVCFGFGFWNTAGGNGEKSLLNLPIHLFGLIEITLGKQKW